MLKVSDAFNSAFAAPDRELRARVTIGKTVYDSDDLTSINYDSGAMTGEQFSIGSTYMNSAKITFSHLVEGLKQLDEVLLEFGIVKADGTTEYVKMGTFIIDDKIQMDRNNNSTTIECMDRMVMLGGAYKSKLSYPATIKSVAVEIANMAGVKVNDTSFARLPNQSINEPIGYSYRDAIGIIAQFAMGFALFDRDGYLDIRTLVDSEFKIDPSQYFLKGLVKNETFFKLNGISCTVVTTSKDENGNETSKTTVLQSGSSSGSQIKLSNNVMTQDVLDRMYESLKFTNYYPFTLNWNGNPAVEAGDWLTLEDMQGNEFKVPNMSYTLTFNGGLTASSKAETSTNSSVTYSYGGSMSSIVNEIGGREGAEGNHIYEGTEDQEPVLPKEGDLWYKHVGPDTDEWIFTNGAWKFIASTKTATDAQKAADAAQKAAEEAKKTANESVATANDAVAKAGFANDTAEEAKSDAAAAGQQAKDALTSAGTALSDAATAKNDATTAITDAKKALTDSGSAMVDSAQARKDSATAIKDAADSLTSAKDAINKVGSLTTSVTSQFTTVNNELKSKVNQTDYDKLKGTVTSQQTEINQNASGINLKADKSYADTINNSVVKNTSSVGLLNDQIALTVSKTELTNTLKPYATQTWTQGQIKTTADQINLSVTKVQSNIDNLSSADRNLLLHSATWDKFGFWSQESVKPTYNADKSEITTTSVHGGPMASKADMSSLIPNDGDTVILSVEAKGTGTLTMNFKPNASGWIGEDRYVLTNTFKRYYYKFKWKNGANNSVVWYNSDSVAKPITLRRPKLVVSSVLNSDWSPAPEDYATEIQYSELKLTIDGIQSTVASKADKTQITQLSDQIKLKADTTALNTLKGTVDKQGSEITLNTNSIKLKADQSSVNTLEGTVDKQGSAIDVNTKAIALKANQSTVDTLTGRVSTAEGKITVQADQIALTVSKTELTNILGDYATQTWTQSQIKSTADQINLSVSKVQTNLDNMQIGSRNYMKNSSTPVKVGVDWGTNRYVILPTYLTEAVGKLTFSAKISDLTDNTSGKISIGMCTPNNANIRYGTRDVQIVDSTLTVTFDIPSDKSDRTYIYIYGNSGTWDGSATGHLTINDYKLERGNKATDWTPAPEDMATEVQFSQLQLTVNGIQGTVQNKADQSQVTQLANQITSTVSQLGTPNYVYNPGFAGSSADGWWLGEVYYMSNNDVSAKDGVTALGINLNNVGTSGTTTFKTAVSKRMPCSGDLSQPISASVNIRTYEVTGDVRFFFTIETFADLTSGRVEYFISNEITGAQGGWRTSSKVNAKPTKPFKYVSIAYQVAFHGVASAHAVYSKPMMNFGPTVAPYTDSSISASQITQLSNDINLRVEKDKVVNQINISPESILIAGQKVHITGQTSIDNAVIEDAMIANVKADKITAGTLNAANVSVINLNANNITTGTLKGANLSLNLNTGEVAFQKGSIKSTNGNLNIRIDDGSMSLTNSLGNGAYFKDGNIYMTDSDIWTPGNPKIQYGTLKMVPNFLSDAGGGVALKGPNGVVVGTDEYPDTGILGDLLSSISGGGITLTKEHIRMASEGDIGIAGGKMYNSGFVGELPAIQVGIAGSYTAPMPWFPSGETGDALFLSGKVVGVVASNGTGNLMTNTISDLSASCDARSGYVLSAATYKRTYGSGDTVTITPNGVFGRISSASKYKLAIGEISTLNDEAHQFLSVKPKQWFDKSESEALADSMTTGNTDYVDDAKALPHNGFIAEDLYTAGLDSYVIRSNDGSIESIQYDRLPVLHHELIRELFNRLDAAETEIYKLKQEANNAS